MATEKDFNVPPYFDDYDETKQFHRILHRPSTPIQARELTQAQSILQNQIERFGNHVFKDGSIVDGVALIYYPNTHYISLEDRFNSNTALFPSSLDETYLITNSTDSNTAVRAVIKIAKDGVKANPPETNRMYFDYVATGSDQANNDVNLFVPGDTLYVYSANQNKFGTLYANNLVDSINTLASNASFSSNGFAYCVSASDGIIFQKGFFTKVDPHVITVSDFSTNVSGYVVGFETTESIVDENTDDSLYDNALGYPNVNAPGAHRLKLSPTLVAKLRTDTTNNVNFFSIIEFDNQIPTQQKDDPEYNKLQQTLSTRTYEESGDYVVEPFRIESRINSSNSQNFYYEVSPGVAFVRGNRIEKIGPTKIEVPRATNTEFAVNQVVTANYGNYVICQEVLGIPDFNQIKEVALYDTAQASVSDIESISAAASGSVVGYCNIRSMVYNSGTKGLPTATYLVYLTNIRMNSGKSFSTDVKSFYATSGTYGTVKGDLVLENSLAVLKEASKNSLLFYNGLSATKSLTNNTGIGDTSFVYTQTKSAGTLDTTGVIQVTIDLAGSGGVEKLNSSTGSVLSGVSAENYNLFLSANAYTANLTGTLAIQTSNAVVNGTSTTFTTSFAVGSLIRIHANSTQQYVRRVVGITNNTVMTLSDTLPMTNTTCNYQKFFVGGSPLPIANVTINSNTQFTANIGMTLSSANQTAYAAYPVLRTQAQKIPKVIKKSRWVTINCASSNSTGPWNLGFPDVHKIRNVYVGTTFANTNPNRTSWFTLDNGQRDSSYELASLVVKPQYANQISSASRFAIEFDFFVANTASSVGFFSVESYPIDDANTANTNAIQTIDIPYYNNLDLRNFIDFRPRKANTAGDTTVLATATVNPSAANSNTFSVAAGGQYLVTPDNNIEADFEYYLPRIDLITLNSSGRFGVNRGEPNVLPRPPFVENDQSAIAEAFVPAYPSPTTREIEGYKFVKPVTTTLKTNKRYTMRDIGVLDAKIQRIEYYTVLNALEQQAKDMTIPDTNGLDRFKNGIFADPFNSHNIGNVSDFEYRIAIDPDLTVARPIYDKHDIDVKYNSSNSANIQQSNAILTLPYNSEMYISQRYATNYRVACESNWEWRATVQLFPSYDIHRDETLAPNINVNVDLSTPWQQFASSPFGTIYGDWRTVASSTSVSSGTVVDGAGNQIVSTSVATTTTQSQTISSLAVNTTTTQYNLGSYITDVSIQPYIREQIIAFTVSGLKPNTTLHAFFDDVNIDAYCAQGTLSGVNVSTLYGAQQNQIVSQSAAYGSGLVSDSTGNVYGLFRIPAGQFRTGDRVFQITNVDSLQVGADAQITSGKARFTADDLSVTRGSSTLTVTQPVIGHTISATSTTQTAYTNTVTIIPFVPPFVPPPPVVSGGTDAGSSSSGDGGGGGDDPITQSFSIENVPSDVSGIFLTRVGVYFKAKDSTLGCSVLISEMKDGFPDATKIIGRGYLASSSISVSADGATETIFSLNQPIYLLSNKQYAFTVQPDANSPEYIVWVGKTGERDIKTNEQVFSNPYSGTMFISANQNTWTAIQKEDIKFNLYRARFTASVGTAMFDNDDDEYLTIDGFVKANTGYSINVGDLVYSVNSSANTANVANLVSFTLKANSNPVATIDYFDEATGKVWLYGSNNGGFSSTTNPTIAIYRTADKTNTSLLTANTLIAYANVISVDNLKYHAVVPKFGLLQPSRTAIKTSFRGTNTSNLVDPSYSVVTNELEYEFPDFERHLMSKSNEIVSLSSVKSSKFKIDIFSESDFVSPVINLSRKAGFFIENLINNDVTNEHTRYGNAISKYVSKTIVLADGQDAEDLNIFLTAHRPYQTDVKVYAKVWNAQDPDQFSDKVWSLMQYDNGSDSTYSSPTNSKDYIEYKFTMPSINAVSTGAFANVVSDAYNPISGTVAIANNSNVLTGTGTAFTTELTVGDVIKVQAGSYFAIRTVTNIANTTSLTVDNGLAATNAASISFVLRTAGNQGIVEYTNTLGSRFIGFKQFAIKLVLLSSNPVVVPKLNDVRGIALQI
jgi:hypothetical protein